MQDEEGKEEDLLLGLMRLQAEGWRLIQHGTWISLSESGLQLKQHSRDHTMLLQGLECVQ